MNSVEINKMAELETDYWWHRGKVFLIQNLIEKYFPQNKDLKILEVGCGTGGLTKHLTNYGDVTGFDISEDAVSYCKSSGLTNIFVQDLNVFDPKPYENTYDLVLALDVLEHIQDDVGAMKKISVILKKDGLFFINVPAHKFLWSEHDEALEHKRRYHSLELLKKLYDSNYEVLNKSHFVFVVSPIIILYRFWGNLFGKSAYPKTSYVILPKKINNFMVKILELETHVMKKISLPFGVTLNAIARPIKNED